MAVASRPTSAGDLIGPERRPASARRPNRGREATDDRIAALVADDGAGDVATQVARAAAGGAAAAIAGGAAAAR